ncbi:protein FAM161B-like [Ruditapes philippinarum]|uniref:protein FAM161B-like n=1 Tax=Ruditapes philippinarum TaxID=129788 RepID=UPI00295C1616|nr:protein FAM161B-like [Ruditapes philippinarum]
MATMATTHGLSVLTNSSVKPPRNPKTGLSASLHERPGPTLGRFSGIYFDDYDQESQAEKEIFEPRFTSRPSSVNAPDLLQLGKLSDEEFYQKLLELKNEQRKILQKCEKVYIEKHQGLIAPTFPEDDVQFETSKRTTKSYDETYRSETFVDEDGVLVSTRRQRSWSPARSASPMEDSGGFSPPRAESPYRDSVRDSLSKPPTGRPHMSLTAKSIASPPSRPRSAPIPRDIARSLEDLRSATLGLKKSFEECEGDYIPDDTVSEPYREQDRSLSRIEHMWQNFSINDYTPRRSLQDRTIKRPSSAKITREEKKQKDNWRHRLTIPKPFTMTLRDERKEKRKSKNLQEFEELKYQKEIEEEEELKKKFKARPVPAHVYLPLYDEIKEKNEEKRRHVKELSAELLKSQEKPFSFLKREDDRKHHQLMERDCNELGKTETRIQKKPDAFKANPVPKHIFDSVVDDKIMEEEEYRKIRIKMRAEEMLRSASLPPNMNAREQIKEQKEREQKMKNKRKGRGMKTATRLRINHEVPNYDALYRQFQQELNRRKGMKESTVAEPFRLETGRTSKSTIERIKKEIEKEEETMRENRWPYKLPRTKVKLGHMSSSLDALPTKSTRSADARTRKTRGQFQKLSQKELKEIEEDRHRRVKEMRLRREIQEKTIAHETPRENPEEKKKKFREAERARMEEYEREMKEMKNRINRRPLLFEQESQVNAKKKAEKKFNATLRSVGLDEEFVQSRGSRSASVHDYTDDYDDDDFEDTAVKRQDDTYTKRRTSDGSLSPVES